MVRPAARKKVEYSDTTVRRRKYDNIRRPKTGKESFSMSGLWVLMRLCIKARAICTYFNTALSKVV